MKKPTICLSMIVKNEAANLPKLFESLKPYITTYCISDTGSSDGTPDIIKGWWDKQGVKGEVIHNEFVDFATNRQQVADASVGKADLIWIMDADDFLEGSIDVSKLETDTLYKLKLGAPGWEYYRPLIYPGDVPIRWTGVLHEYMTPTKKIKEVALQGDYFIISYRNGCRARSNSEDKYINDVKLLEGGIKSCEDTLKQWEGKTFEEVSEEERDNFQYHLNLRTRYLFYLSQTHMDSTDSEEATDAAIDIGKKRVEAGGWYEESYVQCLRIGDMYEHRKKDHP